MALTHCTLTGLDDHTPPERVVELSALYPLAEWGLLYSPGRQGLGGRYPSLATIRTALIQAPAHVRLAVHLCGQAVADALDGGEPVTRDLLQALAARGGRA
jgi:hypothetical protein